MGLLDIYEAMTTPAPEVEKVAETQEQVQPEIAEVIDERMQVLEKYAALADNLLEEEYGTDYTEDDVVKLAQLLINHDIDIQDQMEKVAELQEAGIIMARAFKDELSKQ